MNNVPQVMYPHPTFLAISGIIGAGKTTLADELGKRLGFEVFHELGADTSKLDAFYSDMKKHAFTLQMHLLSKRYEQHQQIVYGGKDAIVDRSIYEDAVFAHVLHNAGCMTDNEYDTYLGNSRIMHNGMRRPTAIIHLDVTPENALERVHQRNRVCESGITLEYLENLHEAYEHFILQLGKEVPVFRIDWNNFGDIGRVADAVVKKVNEFTLVQHVSIV